MVDHELYSMVDYNFNIKEGDNNKKNEVCDGRNDFIRLPNILHDFLQQDKKYGKKQDVDCLNISKSTFVCIKVCGSSCYFQTMLLAWDTGA